MQIITFPNGGFVIHKIEIKGYKGKFSAWYNPQKQLIDFEQIVPTAYGYKSCKNTVNQWNYLSQLGLQQIIVKSIQ